MKYTLLTVLKAKDYVLFFGYSNAQARKQISTDRKQLGRNQITMFDLVNLYGIPFADFLKSIDS